MNAAHFRFLYCLGIDIQLQVYVKKDELTFEAAGLRKLASLYRAIDHPVRLELVKILHTHGTMSVMEICIKIGLEKEAVSQQLGILRRSGLVYSVRHSRFQYYSLDQKTLERLQHLFELQ
jgi:DNA-binding transcriptional ArsR family regulator